MAILHQATISPTKAELLEPWLRTRPWWDGAEQREPVVAFRLDDPAGEVGIECFLHGCADGSTLFVPVTYRAAALPGAEAHLIGTTEHSVLGTRWVHDACADPVFVATLLATVRDGGHQATLTVRRADGSETTREPAATARGTGGRTGPTDLTGPVTVTDGEDRTTVTAGASTLTVLRWVRPLPADLDRPALVGGPAGGPELLLALVG